MVIEKDKARMFLLDFDMLQYVPLIMYLNSLLFTILKLFSFVNSRPFCHTKDVKNNRSSGLKILVCNVIEREFNWETVQMKLLQRRQITNDVHAL